MSIHDVNDFDYHQYIHHQKQSLRFIRATSFETYDRSFLFETRRIFENFITNRLSILPMDNRYLVVPITMSIVEMRQIRSTQTFQKCVDHVESDLFFCQLMSGVNAFFDF